MRWQDSSQRSARAPARRSQAPIQPVWALRYPRQEVERASQATPTRPRAAGRPEQVCPDFHAAVELIGRRWTGAILWALGDKALYFADLVAAVPGISDRLLSARLRELEAEGLVERSVHPGAPARVSYALSEKGRALTPALHALRDWARAWKEG